MELAGSRRSDARLHGARAAGVPRLDTELARCWTLLRAVDYQLWGLNLGLTEDPARCATVIDWLSLAP